MTTRPSSWPEPEEVPIEAVRAALSNGISAPASASEQTDPFRLQAEPELLHAIARAIVAMLPARTGALASGAAHALPLTAICSHISRLGMRYVGEQRPDGRRSVEGGGVQGARVVVIVLLSGDGTDAQQACQAVRDHGGVVSAALSVLDTGEGASRRLQRIGVEYRAVTHVRELRQDGWKAMLGRG